MKPEELLSEIARYAADKKAGEIVELDLRGVLGYTDYFVVCTGNTERQTKAIHDGILEGCKREHEHPAAPGRGPEQARLDPDGLPRRRRAHLHAGNAGLLPAGAALGRGSVKGGRRRESPGRPRPRLCARRARAATPERVPPRRWRGRMRSRSSSVRSETESVKQNNAKAKNPAIRPRPSRRNSSAPRWAWVNTASTLATTGNGASSPLSREPSQPDVAVSASTSAARRKRAAVDPRSAATGPGTARRAGRGAASAQREIRRRPGRARRRRGS